MDKATDLKGYVVNVCCTNFHLVVAQARVTMEASNHVRSMHIKTPVIVVAIVKVVMMGIYFGTILMEYGKASARQMFAFVLMELQSNLKIRKANAG